MPIQNKVRKQKIERYYNLTSKALAIAKRAILKSKSNLKKKQAKEIFTMVECYLKDSRHFENNLDYVNAYGCLNYAHGWLDAGARLKIFNVTDDKLFTI
ncbi:MAG: DUF357 domain-containing protein [archaeon]